MEQRLLSDIKRQFKRHSYELGASITDDFTSMMSGIVQAIENPEFDQKKAKFVELLRETIIKLKKQSDELKALACLSLGSSSPQDPR